MRKLAVLLLVAIVAAGAPAAVAAQQQDGSTDTGTEETIRPPDYTVPGYYEIDVSGRNYRYYDGAKWSGPVVGPDVVGLHSVLQMTRVGRETVELLTILLGGGGDGLFLALMIAAIMGLGELRAVDDPPVPTSAPSPVPSPSPSPKVEAEAASSLSPNYRFVWSWGSTIGGFDGAVSGDEGGWRFTGQSISSWPPSLHVEGGTARCTFMGDPEAPAPEQGWPMDCDLYWQGDATWTGEISGRFYPHHDKEGNLIDFAFKGVGYGTSGDDWSPIEVTLEPCEPGAVC